MPKFLDAPSWYDSDGTLRTIQRVVSLNLSTPGYGLAWNIPVTNAKASQETDNYYVVPGAGTNTSSLLTWQNSGGVYHWGTLAKGTEGTMLTATSSGVSWSKPKLYCHNVTAYRTNMYSFSFSVILNTDTQINDIYVVSSILQDIQGGSYSSDPFYPCTGGAWRASTTISGPPVVSKNTYVDFLCMCAQSSGNVLIRSNQCYYIDDNITRYVSTTTLNSSALYTATWTDRVYNIFDNNITF